MKNIIFKTIFIVGALVSVCAFIYLYDFSGGFSAPSDLDSISMSASAPEQGLGGDVSSSLAASPPDDGSQAPADVQETIKKPANPQKSLKSTPISSSAGDISSGDDGDGQSQNMPDPSSSKSTSTSAGTSTKILPQLCSFSNIGVPSRKLILNEIAWMGSPAQAGETAAQAAAQEWIELKNISASAIDLSGWQVLDSTGNSKMALDGTIPAGGFYVLARNATATATIDASYSGALSNSGEELAVFDTHCDTSDFLDASTGWPGGNNTTKQTLERDVDGSGWHTSVPLGGTPRVENSVPAPVYVSTAAPLPQQYAISVSTIGNGIGTVSSSPAGILCGFTCKADYTSGTKITFMAVPSAGSIFKGWSGGCSGSDQCSLAVSSSIALAADFELVTIAPLVGSQDQSNNQTAPVDATSSQLNHLVIAQIQIGGASSTNDFVKIFNPTGVAVDLSGWKLHKKSSTGTDYSLRVLATGSMIAPGGYFVWANSGGEFADAIGANVSSTETLAADNSVALFDANGNIVDQVAWGTGTSQYVEATAYPTDPTANQILARAITNGVMIDTDNNAVDFVIQ